MKLRILPLLFALTLLATVRLPAETLWTDSNIPAPVLDSLTRAQDLALDLQYDRAEAMIRAVTPQAPKHPLCGVFLVATLLARIQENFKAGSKSVPPAFFEEADRLVAQVERQRDAYPRSPYPRLYLGAAYGMRGLAKLYAGDYFASYIDGKSGAGELRKAVALDPKLYNAYMGLGQFEYYCGTLSGVLRFLLALPGDPNKGLAMLDTCGQKGTYAAWPCRAYRVRLMTAERGEYALAAPELVALQARYPDNYDFAHALFQTLDAGVNTPALRTAASVWLARAGAGLAPPKYAGMDLDALRLDLGRACVRAGDGPGAQAALQPLLARPLPWPGRAQALLDSAAKP